MPKAVLLDLDDTILDDSGAVHDCWQKACAGQSESLTQFGVQTVVGQIKRTGEWFWGDPERHRIGRLDLDRARCEVVRLALLELGIDDADLSTAIGTSYASHRDAGIELFPDAIETVRWLRDSGHRLALLTNGAGDAQRKKIERFGLGGLFDGIFIEGELGFGKPDERVYQAALAALRIAPADAWMVGDNLEWDVAAPQALGMVGVWIDRRGKGLPDSPPCTPRHTVSSLASIRSLIQGSTQPALR